MEENNNSFELGIKKITVSTFIVTFLTVLLVILSRPGLNEEEAENYLSRIILKYFGTSEMVDAYFSVFDRDFVRNIVDNCEVRGELPGSTDLTRRQVFITGDLTFMFLDRVSHLPDGFDQMDDNMSDNLELMRSMDLIPDCKMRLPVQNFTRNEIQELTNYDVNKFLSSYENESNLIRPFTRFMIGIDQELVNSISQNEVEDYLVQTEIRLGLDYISSPTLMISISIYDNSNRNHGMTDLLVIPSLKIDPRLRNLLMSLLQSYRV